MMTWVSPFINTNEVGLTPDTVPCISEIDMPKLEFLVPLNLNGYDN